MYEFSKADLVTQLLIEGFGGNQPAGRGKAGDGFAGGW